MSYMAARRTPSPEALGQRRKLSRRVVTFRLNEAEHEALLGLAKRARMGHSALVRRIVEHYIAEHVPRRQRGRQ
jgi:hypothetical protein